MFDRAAPLAGRFGPWLETITQLDGRSCVLAMGAERLSLRDTQPRPSELRSDDAPPGSYTFAWTLAQVSLSVSVRLKTGRPGFESGSAAK